jgi:hypothetical protein
VLNFGVPGATSEKFVLAMVLLDAFLHGQGQEATFAEASTSVRFLPSAAGIDGRAIEGRVIGAGHCVEFVKAAAGVPRTAAWREELAESGGVQPRLRLDFLQLCPASPQLLRRGLDRGQRCRGLELALGVGAPSANTLDP